MTAYHKEQVIYTTQIELLLCLDYPHTTTHYDQASISVTTKSATEEKKKKILLPEPGQGWQLSQFQWPKLARKQGQHCPKAILYLWGKKKTYRFDELNARK